MAYYFIAPSFFVAGDFEQSAQNIASNQDLYRKALALLLIGNLTIVMLGWTFYVVLRPVDRNLALFALLCRIAEAGVGSVGVLIRFTALENYLASGDETGPPRVVQPVYADVRRRGRHRPQSFT